MFYAHFVLSKKGPLARIWLAAHWDKKLTKAHVFETSIEGSVEAIIQPKVKLALRTTGHLLLGVVRIYSRKAKYLLADCNEAFVKIKMAFRPGVVDLPEENREAAVATITLPETFHDFDTTMADLSDIDVQAQFSVNQSRPEEITMREDLGNITLVGDDGFGDMGFDGGANIMQDSQMDDTLYVKNPESNNMLLDNDVSKSNEEERMDIDFDAQAKPADGFGAGIDDYEGPAGCDDDDSDDDNFGGGVDDELFGDNFMGDGGGLFEEPPVPEVALPPAVETQAPKEGEKTKEVEEEPPPTEQSVVPDQTTLIPNEAEAFALEPIDVTSIGTERKTKRKRKLVIDDQKGIASETMKLQLSDTSDIVTTLDLAPPTKKLMHWKETGGVEKLFALPGRAMVSKRVMRFFNKNLITRPLKESEIDEQDRIQLEQEEEQEQVLEPPTQLPTPVPIPVPVPDISSRLVPQHEEEDRMRAQQDISLQPNMSHLDEPPALEPVMDRVSLAAEVSSLQNTAADNTLIPDESLTQPRTPLTRSMLQQQRAEESEEEDIDDAVFNDIPADPEVTAETEGLDEEEVEERRWSKRTQHMMHIINRHMTHDLPSSTVSFKAISRKNNRKQVASKFYTLLVLKKMQAIEVEQTEPYGDITLSHGPRFESVY